MRKLKNPSEERTYKYLSQKADALGLGLEYETEVLPYTLEKTYRADFILRFPCGHVRYIEDKGYLRPQQDIPKMVAVRRQYPDLDIRILFAKDNKLTPKMRYSDWAIKYGYPYAIGRIPDDWFQAPG